MNAVHFLQEIKFALMRLLKRGERLTLRAYHNKAPGWALFYLFGLLLLWGWDLLFLNRPERKQLEIAFGHSVFVAGVAMVLTFALAWGVVNLLHWFEENEWQLAENFLNSLLNIIRSIPQIIGVLIGYVWITRLMESDRLQKPVSVMILMAVFLSLFIFLEVVDLMQERIRFFKQRDFYNAMRVCAIPTWRIINYDILWKNSLPHLFNKMIAVFSSAIFLQISVDFIISVGLTTRVSAVNLPVTLGSLLADIDSKQDILSIGFSLTHPTYIPQLFFLHLKGISVALLIVFTLLSLFKITSALSERFKL